MRIRSIYIAFVLFIRSFLFSGEVFAQEVNATARLDTSKIMIGDQVHLKLQIDHPEGITIQWPFIPDSILKVEFLEKPKIDTVKSKDNKIISERQSLKITSFDSGFYAIPPFVFHYTKGKDTTNYSSETQALLLTVQTLEVDTNQAIRKIKGVLKVGIDWKEIFLWALAGLGAILLIIGLFLYFKKRKKKPTTIVERVPVRKAHVIALEALERLEAKTLWQKGELKAYHAELTDIVRTFIENRFQIAAMELTTDEILLTIQVAMTDPAAREILSRMLRLADLVKFAKYAALVEENTNSLMSAYEFVKMNILLEEKPLLKETEPEPETETERLNKK